MSISMGTVIIIRTYLAIGIIRNRRIYGRMAEQKAEMNEYINVIKAI